MRTERKEEENLKKDEKKNRRKQKIAGGILAIVLVIGGFAAYRISTVKEFPSNAKVDGVSVGGLTVREAEEKINREANQIELKEDDRDAVTVKTQFKYEIKDTLKNRRALSVVDPRNYIGGGANYSVPLKVIGGEKETAKRIRKAIPDHKGTVETKDAYIDYKTMRIVREVQGDTLDVEALTKDVAENREQSPNEIVFTFKSKDYIATPKVKFDDLQKELKFAKYYLADGLTLRADSGDTVKITPKQLSKVILYTEDGPEYSEEGAQKVAKELAKNYSQDVYTVETEEGAKSLINYGIKSSVDEKKTAESILKAAKSKKKGTLYLKASNQDLSTRVEVSISGQKVYYVQNGKVKLKTSVVTGGPNHATPRGIFRLAYKERNVTLKGSNGDGTDYASKVSYWMPFNGGIGLHDAPWRSSFGGSIYQSGGSHGCVNMPPTKAKQLFGYIDAGTLIYVYD